MQSPKYIAKRHSRGLTSKAWTHSSRTDRDSTLKSKDCEGKWKRREKGSETEMKSECDMGLVVCTCLRRENEKNGKDRTRERKSKERTEKNERSC